MLWTVHKWWSQGDLIAASYAQDIVDLNIIKSSDGSCSESPVVLQEVNGARKDAKKKVVVTPKKAEGPRRAMTAAMRCRDDACFSAPVDAAVLEQDFDFEKNLALFDKRAVFNEIDAALSRPAPCNDYSALASKSGHMVCTPPSYRCDENILGGSALESMCRIRVPGKQEMNYVTDTGLLVPSVSLQLRQQILEAAVQCGYSAERQLEMIGRAASEMVLQLLGGCRRLNPANSHQRPTVVLVCGGHRQGSQVVCCGRQLANHGVEVILWQLPLLAGGLAPVDSLFSAEMALFRRSGGKVRLTIAELSSSRVDMVLASLDSVDGVSRADPTAVATMANWINQSKAPVLWVDPPPNGSTVTPTPQWVLMPLLPLAMDERIVASTGLYLCDVGVPCRVFRDLGVQYASPFGSKFVVVLHAKKP
ncbi:enhancer of mRNA-decapping protein 3 isoform X2 [Dermacentor silvarum]|uniref:enhancer of mRNA-decapping protein 3 isoform X2 n=1 Tax=Dermacentor silvarum TaxID=543639 RepID=UPI002100FA83|nr:enhancer of mRNA-decapping protein 3 isoform X2 [Dermacentor silvarum]XP_049518416.1 enhancer of mRNA-decapping protein 3 isoform X2 [Dermacentor silvarum]